MFDTHGGGMMFHRLKVDAQGRKTPYSPRMFAFLTVSRYASAGVVCSPRLRVNGRCLKRSLTTNWRQMCVSIFQMAVRREATTSRGDSDYVTSALIIGQLHLCKSSVGKIGPI